MAIPASLVFHLQESLLSEGVSRVQTLSNTI